MTNRFGRGLIRAAAVLFLVVFALLGLVYADMFVWVLAEKFNPRGDVLYSWQFVIFEGVAAVILFILCYLLFRYLKRLRAGS